MGWAADDGGSSPRRGALHEAVERVRTGGVTIIMAAADELGRHETVLLRAIQRFIQRCGEPGMVTPRRRSAGFAWPSSTHPSRGGPHPPDHTCPRLIRWPGTTPGTTPHRRTRPHPVPRRAERAPVRTAARGGPDPPAVSEAGAHPGPSTTGPACRGARARGGVPGARRGRATRRRPAPGRAGARGAGRGARITGRVTGRAVASPPTRARSTRSLLSLTGSTPHERSQRSEVARRG